MAVRRLLAAALAALLPALLAGGCRRGGGAEAAAGALVVLATLDTTRADALSSDDFGPPPAAGEPAPDTPVLDGVAARGVRFAVALAHAPTTLSSHTSMMSGLDPHGHGVPRNGHRVPEAVPLLAEELARAGWDTLAVVGASVLGAEMGLDRGFRVYDDDVGTRVRRRVEDPAERVTDRALAALDARRAGRPTFLWVHYFDAHSPWTSAPPEHRARWNRPGYSGRVDGSDAAIAWLVARSRAGRLRRQDALQARALYLSEVAWVDRQLGRLLEGVAERGLDRDLLLVVAGDHGETLDEFAARPYGHGLDVDLVDVRVPLLVAGTGRFDVPAGVVVREPVGLRDVARTVLAAVRRAGLPAPDEPAVGGRDLAPAWAEGGARPAPAPVFAEATKPREATARDGWPNRTLERAVFAEGALLVRSPFAAPEQRLYRLAPGQPPLDDPVLEARLAALLDSWEATAPPEIAPEVEDDTVRAALEALGYLGR